ncbi:DUF4262 domain-containing protein [Mucilaginibacter terrae]|uniref:DUF4262 domain-containing protein n=1 Tax=Mucilaginibacter terrae TaxID=1955052 RepID=UPI003626235B
MDKELNEADKQVLSDIEQYGFHVVHVIEDDAGPGFSFSVGLYHSYKHPEIIILGLTQDLAHTIINNIVLDIQDGKQFDAFTFSDDILNNYQTYFLPVDKANYRSYLGYANWYYKNNDFPVLQLLYPNSKGIFSWEENCPDAFKYLQPILGPVNK